MNKLLSQSNPFGAVSAPAGLSSYGSDPGIAFGKLIQFALRAVIVGAAVYALFNFVLAGYAFFSAADDSKKVAAAWAQIYQTFIGLAVSAGSFVIAALIGEMLFNDPMFLLTPTIPTP